MEEYRLKDAAHLCGVKVRTMREWIKAGKIGANKAKNGWYWQIPDSEILRVNLMRREENDH